MIKITYFSSSASIKSQQLTRKLNNDKEVHLHETVYILVQSLDGLIHVERLKRQHVQCKERELVVHLLSFIVKKETRN